MQTIADKCTGENDVHIYLILGIGVIINDMIIKWHTEFWALSIRCSYTDTETLTRDKNTNYSWKVYWGNSRNITKVIEGKLGCHCDSIQLVELMHFLRAPDPVTCCQFGIFDTLKSCHWQPDSTKPLP